MLFSTVSALALTILAATQSVVALPVDDATSDLEARKSKPSSNNCQTILKGNLIGFDMKGHTIYFSTNSKKQVAYNPKSNHKLYVNFQNCPNYGQAISGDDRGYNGRIYVPSLGLCITNPGLNDLTASHNLQLAPCKKTTSAISDAEHWQYYPGEDTDLNFMYWVGNESTKDPSCSVESGFSTDNNGIPLVDNNQAISLDCGSGHSPGDNRFFIGGSKCTDLQNCE